MKNENDTDEAIAKIHVAGGIVNSAGTDAVRNQDKELYEAARNFLINQFKSESN